MSIEHRPVTAALTSDVPVGTVDVMDAWARSPRFSDLDQCVCACGNPATVVHIRRIAHLPEEIELFCDACSPVVFVQPAHF